MSCQAVEDVGLIAHCPRPERLIDTMGSLGAAAACAVLRFSYAIFVQCGIASVARLHQAEHSVTMTTTIPSDDNFQQHPVIQALIAAAVADPDVLGLVSTGSRAIGAGGPRVGLRCGFPGDGRSVCAVRGTAAHP